MLLPVADPLLKTLSLFATMAPEFVTVTVCDVPPLSPEPPIAKEPPLPNDKLPAPAKPPLPPPPPIDCARIPCEPPPCVSKDPTLSTVTLEPSLPLPPTPPIAFALLTARPAAPDTLIPPLPPPPPIDCAISALDCDPLVTIAP